MYKFLIKTSFWVGVGTFIGIFLATAREMLLAHCFGASFQSDAYVAAIFIPDTMFNLLIGGMLGNIFLPIFMRWKAHWGESSAWSLFYTISSVFLFLGSGLIISSFFWANSFVRLLFPGFQSEQIQLTTALFLIIFPIVLMMLMGMLLKSVINGYQRYILASYCSAAINLIFFGSFFLFFREFGILGFGWATLFSGFGHFILFVPWMIRVSPMLKLDWKHPGIPEFFRGFFAIFLGSGIAGILSSLSQRAVASYLAVGSLAMLTFAARISSLPGKLLIIPVSTPVIAEVTQDIQNDDLHRAKSHLFVSFKLFLIVSIPVVAFLFGFSRSVVQFLFQHGHFNENNTEITAQVVQILILLVYPSAVQTWCHCALMARRKFKVMGITSVAHAGISIALNIVLGRLWGLNGLALSTVFSYVAAAVICGYSVKDFFPNVITLSSYWVQDLLKLGGLLILVHGIALQMGFWVQNFNFPAILAIFIGSIGIGTIYVGLVFLLKVRESRLLIQLISQRL